MCVYIKNYCSSVLKNKRLNFVFLILLWLSSSAFAVDELTGVLTSAKENFGSDSVFIKLLYAAEIIAGGYAWHKTKHPSAVIGIVVLALFITFALKHWVFG